MRYLTYQEARELSTPFYLFDVNHLANQVHIIKKAFQDNWPNKIIAYSVKTNSLPFLAKTLLKLNVAAEVVSEDEFNLVNKLHYYGDNIICNGPIKHKSWVKSILTQGCYLNIDSRNELDIIVDYANKHRNNQINVGLRVNNDLENVFPYASTAGYVGSRFGFSYETGDLLSAIQQLSSATNVRIKGLHLHTSTNVRSLDIYKYLVTRFDEIVKKYQLQDIAYLDVGGGFYGEVKDKPQWDDYIGVIAHELFLKGYNPDNLKIIIEPGVSLLAGCFSYYTQVEDVKDTLRSHFVVLDGSRFHIDPLMHKSISNYFFSIYQGHESCPIFNNPQTLCGYTCLEYDILFQLNNTRLLKRGDILRFDKIGAYTMTFSPLFISWFPTVYYVDGDNFGIARGKWTSDEFLQKSNI